MARRKRKYHRRKPFGVKLKKNTVYTVTALWLWLAAGLVTLSFVATDVMLTRLRNSLFYHFGWCTFFVPPLLVLASFLLFKVKSPIGNPNVFSGAGIVVLALSGLTQAGIIGEWLWTFVADAVAIEAAFLVYLAVLMIGCIILFNTSLDTFMNFLLVGMQTIWDYISGLFQKSSSGRTPAFGSDKQLTIKGTDIKQALAKAPIVPPPVGSKKEGSQTDKRPAGNELGIGSPTNFKGDMSMWEYPAVSLLSEAPSQKADRGDVKRNAGIIEKTLESFGITTRVVEVNKGPAVTQYAIKLALGTKVSKITSLSSDLALALAAPTGQVRIEAPIPGRDLVGVEIPNRGLEFVTLKHMLQSQTMSKAKHRLTVALGLDVSGNPVIANIAKMPHVLVAGTTGSGKSVLINAWICSLLYRTTPAEVRLIMVDPKRVELIGYNGVPHLLTPVIVEPDKILSSLRWAMMEMEERYKQFSQVGVRNIDGFNELSGFQAMPYIVIFIDELADLMAYAPVEVEDTICRLAQMARATGIHLVVATQRPSVDVITGLIKANIPSRIAFNVSSMVDSRVIIDMPGAEKLLGRGDMLYIPPDQSKPSRIQGTFVSDAEVQKVVEFMKEKNQPVQYTAEVVTQPVGMLKKGTGKSMGGGGADGRDDLFEDALRLVCQHDKASASLIQRRLSVGYARAARILDQLEEEGIIGPAEGSKPRDVLIKNPDDYLAAQAQQA